MDYGEEQLYYQPCPTTFIAKYMDLPAKYENKNIAINIGMDRVQRRFGDSLEIVLSQIATSVKKIHNLGYNIFLTMHCDVDYYFTQFLYGQDFFEFKVIDMVRTSPVEVINFYRNMDLVIGSRGHASMIPFGVGTKIISIGGHPKLKSFLEDIDALDWFVDVEDVTAVGDNLMQTFENVINDDVKIYEHIDKIQNKFFEITVNNLQNIKKIINEYK